jgi:membrane protein
LFFVLVAILGTVVVPIVLSAFGLEGSAVCVAALLRWPIMFVVITLFLGAFYRLSLRHKRPGIPWITAGGVIAALLWMVGSIFFSIYVENFAHYNISFGALGGVVTLLMWMWLSAYIILIGAEINAALDDSKAGASAAEASARHTVSDGSS